MQDSRFHEGALCALAFHADGSRRVTVENQVPCRITSILVLRPEEENTRLSVILGYLRDNAWTEGKKVEMKGSELYVVFDSSESKRQGRIRVR
jgi:hypothetical protein